MQVYFASRPSISLKVGAFATAVFTDGAFIDDVDLLPGLEEAAIGAGSGAATGIELSLVLTSLIVNFAPLGILCNV